MTIDDALAHAGDLTMVPDEIMDGIVEAMPGYLWVIDHWSDDTGLLEYDGIEREARLIRCGRCGETTLEQQRRRRWPRVLPQNEIARCPSCAEQLQIKHVTRGIRGMVDRLDVIWYRKSAADPDVVVAYAAQCRRDYRHADARTPWEALPDVHVMGIAVFDARAREDLRLQRRWIPDAEDAPCGSPICGAGDWACDWTWTRRGSMTRLTFGNEGAGIGGHIPERIRLEDSHARAIRGTPFERAWHEGYFAGAGDGVAAMDMITRLPCVEYMTKLGMHEVVRRRLEDALPARLINWHGRDMASVLGLSRERLGQIKGKRIRITAELIAVLQLADRRGVRCGIETAEGAAYAARLMGKEIKERLWAALERFAPPRRAKALKYIARHHAEGLSDIADYWRMVLEAGGSLESDAEAFPRDFREAHDRLAGRAYIASHADEDAAIAARLEALQAEYGFAFGGLILRPAASAAELLWESEALEHCVASYINSYARGKTVICVLRRAVEPDRPWRTVEISAKTGHVVQDRGWHNDFGRYDLRDARYKAMLALFWEVWRERGQQRRSA